MTKLHALFSGYKFEPSVSSIFHIMYLRIAVVTGTCIPTSFFFFFTDHFCSSSCSREEKLQVLF